MELYRPTYEFKEKRILVFSNILIMLENRKWLDEKMKIQFLENMKAAIYDPIYKLTDLIHPVIKDVDIYFVEDRSFFKKKSYDKILNIDDHNKRSIILVDDAKLLKTNKTLKKMKNVEIWLDNDFITDIVGHVLIPTHKLLSADEKKAFYDESKIKPQDILEIYKTDRMSRYFNAQLEDIFEITRTNMQSGIETVWRRVVPDHQT